MEEDIAVGGGGGGSAETIEAPVAEPIQESPQGPTRSERIKALTGKARDYYQKTGDVDGAERKMQKAAERTAAETILPGAEPAQTETASGPVEAEQRPKATRQDRNFKSLSDKASQLERELIEAKAKLSIYEKGESTASRTSAPAAPVKEEKPATSNDPRPKFPLIKDFKTEGDFDKAVEKWQTDDAAWMQRQLDSRLNGERQNQQSAEAKKEWDQQLSGARAVHKDFDQIVLSDKLPVSYATLQTLWSLKDGAERSYSLAKNSELATRIAELTHIPGENKFQSYAEFIKAVRANPDTALLYGEKLALAKAEIAKLHVATGKAAPPQRPLKEVIRQSARPSAEVNTEESAVPITDPIAKALEDIKNHVPGAQKAYTRLKNAEDLRRRNGR